MGDALYRNTGDGTFADVTGQARIRGNRRGMGLAVGDYDDDGRSDTLRHRLRATGPAAVSRRAGYRPAAAFR